MMPSRGVRVLLALLLLGPVLLAGEPAVGSVLAPTNGDSVRKLSSKQIAAINKRVAQRNKRILKQEAYNYAVDYLRDFRDSVLLDDAAAVRDSRESVDCYASTSRGASCSFLGRVDKLRNDSPVWVQYFWGGVARTEKVGTRIRYRVTGFGYDFLILGSAG